MNHDYDLRFSGSVGMPTPMTTPTMTMTQTMTRIFQILRYAPPHDQMVIIFYFEGFPTANVFSTHGSFASQRGQGSRAALVALVKGINVPAKLQYIAPPELPLGMLYETFGGRVKHMLEWGRGLSRAENSERIREHGSSLYMYAPLRGRGGVC